MSKKILVVLGASLASLGLATGVRADDSRAVVPSDPQTVAASADFTVSYVGCASEVDTQVAFVFQGVTQTVACVVPEVSDVAFLDEGSAGPVTFKAPALPGTYTGTATVVFPSDDLRGPDDGQQGPIGIRMQQNVQCGDQSPSSCRTFTVIVPAPPQQPAPSTSTTTTTTTTTTIAATTTTVAPTTTLAGSGPATPTTTTTTTTAPRVGTLPATGSDGNDDTAMLAIVFVAAGGALLLASRWRRSQPSS